MYRSFHNDDVIARIRQECKVTQADVDSVKKWYDYQMKSLDPFP